MDIYWFLSGTKTLAIYGIINLPYLAFMFCITAVCGALYMLLSSLSPPFPPSLLSLFFEVYKSFFKC